MASLAEELSKLASPTPKFRDPEDDFDEGLSNQIASVYSGETEAQDNALETPSRLRRQAVSLLSDADVKYQGKRTSRKSLTRDEEDISDISDENETTISKTNTSDGSEGEQSEESSDEGDKSSEEEDDMDISAFRKQLELKTSGRKDGKGFQYKDDGDYGRYGGVSDDMEDSGDEEDEDEDSGEEDSEDNSAGDSGVEDGDKGQTSEDVSSFSKTDIAEEMEKGMAAKHQISLWDSLLEGRIKLQKALTLVNQLPQPDTWQAIQQEGGDNFSEASSHCRVAVKTLLDNLIELQTLLLVQNSETRYVVDGQNATDSSIPMDSDDEEITSESDSEEKTTKTSKSPSVPRKYLKRKLNMEDYPEFLAKRHSDFESYRNNTIQKWNDKTRLATGKLRSKSFGAFEQSALKQIEQIMADKERLIKRTQLKRSVYKILGKEDNVQKESPSEINTDSDIPNETKKAEPTQTHDGEIFDDDDFYHQLLRELIERKTSDVSDPIALSRQWLEIQRLRTKVKKKVDTKASKGRKLRFDVHKKLVNFMAPVDHSTWPEESKDDLYRSLFGKRFESLKNTTDNR